MDAHYTQTVAQGAKRGVRARGGGDDTDEGRPIKVVFRWTRLGPDAARWKQAFSLDPPVKGRLVNSVGTFYADDTLCGKPIRMRFTWSQITPTSAQWEQAFSPDGGKTWETNWTMEFRRAP